VERRKIGEEFSLTGYCLPNTPLSGDIPTDIHVRRAACREREAFMCVLLRTCRHTSRSIGTGNWHVSHGVTLWFLYEEEESAKVLGSHFRENSLPDG
jgi:hypothetical protein